MQRRHERCLLPAEKAERQVVHVEMQDVELVCTPADGFQQQHMGRERVADRGSSRNACGDDRLEFGRGDRISTGEQGNVVAERDQFLGQEGNDTFGAAIELWWNRFV